MTGFVDDPAALVERLKERLAFGQPAFPASVVEGLIAALLAETEQRKKLLEWVETRLASDHVSGEWRRDLIYVESALSDAVEPGP